MIEAFDLNEKHGLSRDLRPETLFAPEVESNLTSDTITGVETGGVVLVSEAAGNECLPSNIVDEPSIDNINGIDESASLAQDLENTGADVVEAILSTNEAQVEVTNEGESAAVQLSDEERAGLISQLKDLSTQVLEAENLLQEAAEAEDYDQAAAYSDRVDELKHKVNEVM